mmetsp:Transcript_65843/g.212390  ORF Transcript_65843/g.212390 Transcript_65843/m.212390 type:complete len:278 (-) Transcript_65843:13-846(-)
MSCAASRRALAVREAQRLPRRPLKTQAASLPLAELRLARVDPAILFVLGKGALLVQDLAVAAADLELHLGAPRGDDFEAVGLCQGLGFCAEVLQVVEEALLLEPQGERPVLRPSLQGVQLVLLRSREEACVLVVEGRETRPHDGLGALGLLALENLVHHLPTVAMESLQVLGGQDLLVALGRLLRGQRVREARAPQHRRAPRARRRAGGAGAHEARARGGLASSREKQRRGNGSEADCQRATAPPQGPAHGARLRKGRGAQRHASENCGAAKIPSAS